MSNAAPRLVTHAQHIIMTHIYSHLHFHIELPQTLHVAFSVSLSLPSNRTKRNLNYFIEFNFLHHR